MRTRLRDRIRHRLVPAPEGPEVVAAAPEVALRDVFRRFWPDARPYRKWIPVLVALIAAGALVATAEIWLFKLVVDDVLIPGDLSIVAWIVAAYIGLTLLGGLIGFTDDYLSTWLAERFLMNLRMRVLSHLHRLSLDVLDRRRVGDLIARVTSDVQAIESFVLSGVADGLTALLRILFFGGALFFLEWRLALVALIVVPLFYVVGKAFSRLIKQASREQCRRVGSLSSLAEEGIANAALVQSLNRQDAELALFRLEDEGVVRAERVRRDGSGRRQRAIGHRERRVRLARGGDLGLRRPGGPGLPAAARARRAGPIAPRSPAGAGVPNRPVSRPAAGGAADTGRAAVGPQDPRVGLSAETESRHSELSLHA